MPANDNQYNRPMLSVAMIVRNAADLLSETLDTIRGIADEIVVLDTGSQDATVRVAQEGGATVVEAEWRDDFSAARNTCAEHVTGDWILWLDAGETLDETPAQQLRNFVDEEANPDKAYMLFIQLPSTCRQLTGEQIGQVRLTPGRREIRFEGRLRETLSCSIVAAGMEIDALPCQIQRPPSDLDPRIKKAKGQRNLRIIDHAAKTTDDGASDPSTLMLARAEALQNLGRYDEAIDAYRDTVDISASGSTVMLEAYYGILTIYDGRPAEKEAQIAICLEALDIYPLDAQLLCGMGSYLLNQGRVDLAARSYEIAATHGRVDPATWHLADIMEVATTCLSLTHQLQGRPDKAIDVLQTALEQRPESMRLRRQLLDLLIKNARRDEAMIEFDRLPEDEPHREALRSAVRGALFASDKDYAAAEPYLKTAYSAGCRDTLCLRWLAVTYLSIGKIDAAEPVLAQWREIDPQNGEAAAYQQAIAERLATRAESAIPSLTRIPSLTSMPTGAVPLRHLPKKPGTTVRVDPGKPVLSTMPAISSTDVSTPAK